MCIFICIYTIILLTSFTLLIYVLICFIANSICQCVILCHVHVDFKLMFFSTIIQPIDQQKELFPFFPSSGYIKKIKTKLSIIDMYLARNETQTQAMVRFKVRDSS